MRERSPEDQVRCQQFEFNVFDLGSSSGAESLFLLVEVEKQPYPSTTAPANVRPSEMLLSW